MPVLAVFICVVCPCRSTARMLRRWRSRDRGVEHRQLRPQPQGSEVCNINHGWSWTFSISNYLCNSSHHQASGELSLTHVCTFVPMSPPPFVPLKQIIWKFYTRSRTIKGRPDLMSALITFSVVFLFTLSGSRLIRILKQLITRCPWYSLVWQNNQSINQLQNISII